jgi:hypothetical protein
MLRRLFIGLVEGLVIGIALAVAATRAFGASTPSVSFAALLAASAGFVVGLVAGRPIWARNAKTEALLKAGVGALVAVGLSFALGRWLALPLDLNAYSFGAGPAGKLTALVLPLISVALSSFFELDNSAGGEAKPLAAPGARQRLQSSEPNSPMSETDREAFDEPPAERNNEKR